jgi:type II secretory pathway pseudopilin PulG
VLGFIAGVAVPKYFDLTERAATSAITAHFKQLRNAFGAYYRDNNAWPPDNDGTPGNTNYINAYVNAASIFETRPPILGGRWNWNWFASMPTNPDVCIYSIGTPNAQQTRIMTAIDAALDDGNLSTGIVRWEPASWGGTLRHFWTTPP